MNSHFHTVIFDFDYTLADSSRSVVASVNFALVELGLPTAPARMIHRTIGLSLRNTFLKLMGQHVTQANEFARLFVKQADEIMVDLTVLFETVPMTVDSLRRGSIHLDIVSTKFRYRIEVILRRENLLDAFEFIVGREDVSEHKPKPKGLLAGVQRMGGSLSIALYVEDSVTDAETAKRAVVPFVAVLSGVTSREYFEDYEVYEGIADLSELYQQTYRSCELQGRSDVS
jgi:phosphoglycolate phosphatase